MLASASITRSTPSSFKCTNASWRPSGEYTGNVSRPGNEVTLRVTPVFRLVANRSSCSGAPADHATSAPSGDQASEVASNGTSATARGLPPTGMVHNLPSASTPISRPSGERANPMKPLADSRNPGSGNRACGSARRARVIESSALNRISVGLPPDADTFQRRPSAEYKNALPSATQRIRVDVTSACFVTRMADPLAVSLVSISCTHTWVRPSESGAK